MIQTETMPVTQNNDAELVAQSLAGSHDAFRQIVERYQTLICSLAYCGTGSMSQSEDRVDCGLCLADDGAFHLVLSHR